jgi:heme exporter protein A
VSLSAAGDEGAADQLLQMAGVAGWRGGRVLFEGIEVSLMRGQAALVSGPNGVGKSSLLRIAAGLLRPAAGIVTRAAAALADEQLALEPRRSLEDALGFWARLDRSATGPALEAMGLAHLRQIPVRILSTGQRKRAALARVIASGAPLWILDEPGNGLDAEGQERLAAAMAAHRAGGGAILAATHQPLGLADAVEVRLA